ncbi:MAG TPA: hypothetical protein PLW65_13535 [Pseudomonadota bacterium]|nr:hypothetical protein [Pseudomonadota bacterium]
MADSDSQAPQTTQTNSEGVAEHRAPEQPDEAPTPDQADVESPDDGDAADPGGGRSLRAHKAAGAVKSASLGRSGQAPSSRATNPGSGRSLRDAVNAAESRARRTFPGRTR